jgi:hypothetical protein
MSMTSQAHAQNPGFDKMAVVAVDKLRGEGKRKQGSLIEPGNISRELATALAEHVPSDLIARRIEELVNGTMTNKAGETVPDIRAREAGLKLALNYKVGTPIARAENINVNFDADASIGLAERLSNSPALRKSLKEIIGKIEGTELVEK